MNAGLAQGFVRFGTNHELVLRALHELGNLCHSDLVEELEIEARRVSVAIAQLAKHGFIHQHPAARQYDTGRRTQAMWGLQPYAGSKSLRPRVPVRERTARYRASRRLRVASVFHLGAAGALTT